MKDLRNLYRMGQIRNVMVHCLLCEDTVDEAILYILKEKQEEFDMYADESAMAEAEASLIDRAWIDSVIERERSRYLPAVVDS